MSNRIAPAMIEKLSREMQSLSEGGDTPAFRKFYNNVSSISVFVSFDVGICATPSVSGFVWGFDIKRRISRIQDGAGRWRYQKEVGSASVQGLVPFIPEIKMTLAGALLFAMELDPYSFVVRAEKTLPRAYKTSAKQQESDDDDTL